MVIDESELIYGELSYEKRIVAFFDILGWKNEIDTAGTDSRHIARLASVLRLFSAFKNRIGDADARIATFSDNVVFSKRYSEGDIAWLLEGLATTQLGAAASGFWIRGGVTVGEIYHDEHVVFGPALNQAYRLESLKAKFPRIILDSAALPIPDGTDFICFEEDCFLDPFKPQFWDRIQKQHPIDQDIIDEFSTLSGTDIPVEPVLYNGTTILMSIIQRLNHELTTIEDPRAWSKLAWLFDRIAIVLGTNISASMLPKSAALNNREQKQRAG